MERGRATGEHSSPRQQRGHAFATYDKTVITSIDAPVSLSELNSNDSPWTEHARCLEDSEATTNFGEHSMYGGLSPSYALLPDVDDGNESAAPWSEDDKCMPSTTQICTPSSLIGQRSREALSNDEVVMLQGSNTPSPDFAVSSGLWNWLTTPRRQRGQDSPTICQRLLDLFDGLAQSPGPPVTNANDHQDVSPLQLDEHTIQKVRGRSKSTRILSQQVRQSTNNPPSHPGPTDPNGLHRRPGAQAAVAEELRYLSSYGRRVSGSSSPGRRNSTSLLGQRTVSVDSFGNGLRVDRVSRNPSLDFMQSGCRTEARPYQAREGCVHKDGQLCGRIRAQRPNRLRLSRKRLRVKISCQDLVPTRPGSAVSPDNDGIPTYTMDGGFPVNGRRYDAADTDTMTAASPESSLVHRHRSRRCPGQPSITDLSLAQSVVKGTANGIPHTQTSEHTYTLAQLGSTHTTHTNLDTAESYRPIDHNYSDESDSESPLQATYRRSHRSVTNNENEKNGGRRDHQTKEQHASRLVSSGYVNTAVSGTITAQNTTLSRDSVRRMDEYQVGIAFGIPAELDPNRLFTPQRSFVKNLLALHATCQWNMRTQASPPPFLPAGMSAEGLQMVGPPICSGSFGDVVEEAYHSTLQLSMWPRTGGPTVSQRIILGALADDNIDRRAHIARYLRNSEMRSLANEVEHIKPHPDKKWRLEADQEEKRMNDDDDDDDNALLEGRAVMCPPRAESATMKKAVPRIRPVTPKARHGPASLQTTAGTLSRVRIWRSVIQDRAARVKVNARLINIWSTSKSKRSSTKSHPKMVRSPPLGKTDLKSLLQDKKKKELVDVPRQACYGNWPSKDRSATFIHLQYRSRSASVPEADLARCQVVTAEAVPITRQRPTATRFGGKPHAGSRGNEISSMPGHQMSGRPRRNPTGSSDHIRSQPPRWEALSGVTPPRTVQCGEAMRVSVEPSGIITFGHELSSSLDEVPRTRLRPLDDRFKEHIDSIKDIKTLLEWDDPPSPDPLADENFLPNMLDLPISGAIKKSRELIKLAKNVVPQDFKQDRSAGSAKTELPIMSAHGKVLTTSTSALPTSSSEHSRRSLIHGFDFDGTSAR